MVELIMTTEVEKPSSTGLPELGVTASVSNDNPDLDAMNQSFAELRQSGEWTVVSCTCNSALSSSTDGLISYSDSKAECTCSNVLADCSSNGSSSDVAVINESDTEEVTDNFKPIIDIDGVSRITNINLLGEKSLLGSFNGSVKSVTDDNAVEISKISITKPSPQARLRLRWKKQPHSSLDSTNDGSGSFDDQRKSSVYKKSLKKSSKRMKICDESFITTDRTITFLLCLILIFCIMALICLIFAFFMRREQAEPTTIPLKPSTFFSEVDSLEKEFSECLEMKKRGLDCKRNLMFWKNSLSQLLVNENQRILNMIQKLEEIGLNSESLKDDLTAPNKRSMEKSNGDHVPEFGIRNDRYRPDLDGYYQYGNLPEYDADSTSKNAQAELDSEENASANFDSSIDEEEMDDIEDEEENASANFDSSIDEEEMDDIEDEEENEKATIESLKHQMERLKNLYHLEKTESEKWKRLFAEQTDNENVDETVGNKKETEDFLGINTFFPMWKEFKETANSWNPHLEKFRRKLAKVIKDNLNGASKLTDSLRKKWVKSSEKLSKRLQKLRHAWNEEESENCDKESTCFGSRRADPLDSEDALPNSNSQADWYTKRFNTLKGESPYLSDSEEDQGNWIFKRARGRAEKKESPEKLSKKVKKAKKNEEVKKKKSRY